MTAPPGIVSFQDPCYLISGIVTSHAVESVKIALLLPDGSPGVVSLSSDKFTLVEGLYNEIILTNPLGPVRRFYRAQGNTHVPKNAWGVVQAVPPANPANPERLLLQLFAGGEEINIAFFPDVEPAAFTEPPEAEDPKLSAPHSVNINEGGVWNGLSESAYLSVFYTASGGRFQETPPVLPGNETGNILQDVTIPVFRLRLLGGHVDYGVPGNVTVPPGESVVVMGTYKQPYLVPFPPFGSLQKVNLIPVN